MLYLRPTARIEPALFYCPKTRHQTPSKSELRNVSQAFLTDFTISHTVLKLDEIARLFIASVPSKISRSASSQPSIYGDEDGVIQPSWTHRIFMIGRDR